jgi:hypothetical protein
MTKESEKSQPIGGKPKTRDEADQRKERVQDNVAPGQEKGRTVKPKNPDVGDLDRDR